MRALAIQVVLGVTPNQRLSQRLASSRLQVPDTDSLAMGHGKQTAIRAQCHMTGSVIRKQSSDLQHVRNIFPSFFVEREDKAT